MRPLTATEIRAALGELAARLARRRAQGRLYVAGGAAMALAYDSDKLTRDIDAAVVEGHGMVMEAVREIACSRQWPTTWLNGEATPYLPTVPDRRGRVVFDHPALKVVVASPEHMLAMKVRAGPVLRHCRHPPTAPTNRPIRRVRDRKPRGVGFPRRVPGRKAATVA